MYKQTPLTHPITVCYAKLAKYSFAYFRVRHCSIIKKDHQTAGGQSTPVFFLVFPWTALRDFRPPCPADPVTNHPLFPDPGSAPSTGDRHSDRPRVVSAACTGSPVTPHSAAAAAVVSMRHVQTSSAAVAVSLLPCVVGRLGSVFRSQSSVGPTLVRF